jgi:hypothetical protein
VPPRADVNVPERRPVMKAGMLFTGGGPLVILTSHNSFTDPALVRKLRAKGIEKFIAYELPIAEVQKKYGGHFMLVMQDLQETDDLRVLDISGDRVFRLFKLTELPKPIVFEPGEAAKEPAKAAKDDVH